MKNRIYLFELPFQSLKESVPLSVFPSNMNATASKLLHSKCRGAYPGASVSRATVPDQQVAWASPFAEYAPTLYTAPVVASGPVWADKDFLTDKDAAAAVKWNAVDGKIDRRSFEGEYKLDEHNIPQNPLGRTGMRGRGLLGRFGPNHAADPIVTRYIHHPRSFLHTFQSCLIEFSAVQGQKSSFHSLSDFFGAILFEPSTDLSLSCIVIDGSALKMERLSRRKERRFWSLYASKEPTVEVGRFPVAWSILESLCRLP